jgi:hypothetical protein
VSKVRRLTDERTFTDDQITALLAGLILSHTEWSSFVYDRPGNAVRQAQDIMDTLRGRLTREQRWQAEAAERERLYAERRAQRDKVLASGRIHSAHWDA